MRSIQYRNNKFSVKKRSNYGKVNKEKGEWKYIINKKLLKDERDILSRFKDVVVFLAVTGTPSIANRKYRTNAMAFDIPLI